jgi:hypothetical protein
MAIIFIQQRKKQKYLIILIAIALIILIFVWWNFLIKPNKETPVITEKTFTLKEVKINFDVFNNPLLKELQPLEEITPFVESIATPSQEGVTEKIGRENPFLPYQIPLPSPSPKP